jgi:hypothetical protein
MAEREGFEPSIHLATYTHFPGVRLQPLGHLSSIFLSTNSNYLITRRAPCFFVLLPAKHQNPARMFHHSGVRRREAALRWNSVSPARPSLRTTKQTRTSVSRSEYFLIAPGPTSVSGVRRGEAALHLIRLTHSAHSK